MHTSGNARTPSPEAFDFLEGHLGRRPQVALLSGDASFRTYYRVQDGENSWVLMDAPPDKEDSRPFVDIARFLKGHGVPVPEIHAQDLSRGFLLLEDLGDETFLQALAREEAGPLYEQAVATLLDMQATPQDGATLAHGRPFDRKLLRFELSLFTDWYVEGILKTPIAPEDRERFDVLFHRLIDQLLEQPVFFVHRDYHSRNLMWRPGGIGVIDFQDAVMGPITYDLASLLRDCYVAWDAPFRQAVMAQWLAGARTRLGYKADEDTFRSHFDHMALQRNLKAVGIFGRLSLRDGKHGYLNDIPRTMGYVREMLGNYPQWEALLSLMMRYAPQETTE